jgi:hypothetical protein
MTLDMFRKITIIWMKGKPGINIFGDKKKGFNK